MRIERSGCVSLLGRSEHGILSTVHPRRGVDAVPVCFALDDPLVAVPIDTVKEKTTPDLQRVTNVEADPRAALLCEHWDATDWSRLWWVRATLVRSDAEPGRRASLEDLLRANYPQYGKDAHSIASILVFRITELTGWSATAR